MAVHAWKAINLHKVLRMGEQCSGDRSLVGVCRTDLVPLRWVRLGHEVYRSLCNRIG